MTTAMVYGCPMPPAHDDPRPTRDPDKEDDAGYSHRLIAWCDRHPEYTGPGSMPPAHIDPSPTLPPPSHDGQADEPGPVAELRPDGQGGRAPAGERRKRVNVAVLQNACFVQGWTLTATDDGTFFVISGDAAEVRYEVAGLPQMSAAGEFDAVLDMIAVVAAAQVAR